MAGRRWYCGDFAHGCAKCATVTTQDNESGWDQSETISYCIGKLHIGSIPEFELGERTPPPPLCNMDVTRITIGKMESMFSKQNPNSNCRPVLWVDAQRGGMWVRSVRPHVFSNFQVLWRSQEAAAMWTESTWPTFSAIPPAWSCINWGREGRSLQLRLLSI